jgi:hypothetical protein
MVALVVLLTCLSTTSIFPTVVRRALISPYSLRVVPCIAVWAIAIAEMLGRQKASGLESQ